MGTIDLTGQLIVKTTWEVDDLTGFTTIQFWNDAEDTMLGEFIIENRRFRSIDSAISEIGKTLFPDQDVAMFEGHRSSFRKDTNKGKTEFLP